MHLAKTSQVLRTVRAISERSASFMAIGYGQASSRAPVLLLSPGQGLLNSMAAIYTARHIQVPMIVLSNKHSDTQRRPGTRSRQPGTSIQADQNGQQKPSAVEVTRLIRRFY